MGEEQTNCILLMWSGGVSSTAMLLGLLSKRKYKQYDILAHHVHLHDVRGVARPEAAACREVLNYVENKKKYRKFFFSESSHEFMFMRPPRYSRGIMELDVVSFVAANICAGNSTVNRVMIGGTLTDTEQNDNYHLMLARSKRIFDSVLQYSPNVAELSVEYIYMEEEAPDIFEELPREVKKLVFSCTKPSYEEGGTPVMACEECDKCAQRDLE